MGAFGDLASRKVAIWADGSGGGDGGHSGSRQGQSPLLRLLIRIRALVLFEISSTDSIQFWAYVALALLFLFYTCRCCCCCCGRRRAGRKANKPPGGGGRRSPSRDLSD